MILFLQSITLFACIVPLHAADQKNPDARSCRILALDTPAQVPGNLYLFDGTEVHRATPGKMSFSPVYDLPPGNIRLSLLPTHPIKLDSGRNQFQIPERAPSAMVPSALSDFYMILMPDHSNPVLPVKIQLVDAGIERFVAGRMMWRNLTGYAVGGILGKSKLRLDPYSVGIIEPPAEDFGDYYVNIFYLNPQGKHAEPLCETRWQHDPRSRSVFFILDRKDQNPPRIVGIPDFRPEGFSCQKPNP